MNEETVQIMLENGEIVEMSVERLKAAHAAALAMERDEALRFDTEDMMPLEVPEYE